MTTRRRTGRARIDIRHLPTRPRCHPSRFLVRDIGGLVGTYVLRGPDYETVVITRATSVEALDAMERAIMTTKLLPGEDPALLPGPDRIEIHHVTGYHIPAHQTASMKGH